MEDKTKFLLTISRQTLAELKRESVLKSISTSEYICKILEQRKEIEKEEDKKKKT